MNGPLVLFQATNELLKASKNPKFVGISSPAGSITAGSQFPGGLYTYGSSKAALSWVLRKLHHDFENIGECQANACSDDDRVVLTVLRQSPSPSAPVPSTRIWVRWPSRRSRG